MRGNAGSAQLVLQEIYLAEKGEAVVRMGMP